MASRHREAAQSPVQSLLIAVPLAITSWRISSITERTGPPPDRAGLHAEERRFAWRARGSPRQSDSSSFGHLGFSSYRR